MVIMVLGRGVRVTRGYGGRGYYGSRGPGYGIVDGDIMVIRVRVTGGMGGIADNTLFGKLERRGAGR